MKVTTAKEIIRRRLYRLRRKKRREIPKKIWEGKGA